MRFTLFGDSAKGVLLGIIAFTLVSSSFPIQAVGAASGPLFSMTLIAPATTNPTRRQWAAIIQNSLSAANIAANLIYVSFTQDLSILYGCSNGCPANDFAHGGWDVGFVGNGAGTALADFGTQNVVDYRNEGPNDVPPVGSDKTFFNNATYNSLSDQYSTDFNQAERLTIAQKMVKIVAQERPGIVILYQVELYAVNPSLHPWGTTSAITPTTVGLDWQHWATGSTTLLNVGETGDLDAANPLPTSAQNSFYDRFLYGPTTSANLEEPDSRGVGIYFHALANKIVSSPDHLTWTVSFKAHNFQDGVAVTADDYVFAQMAELRLDVGWVGLGTSQGLLGAFDDFTFLNGTTRYVNNGTYSMTKPTNWKPTSSWKSLNATAFQFTMPAPYIFTDPLITGGSALPMHIYEKVSGSTWSQSPLSGFTGPSGGLSTSRFTVTWDKARYGGNGSYAWAYGPVSDGAYIYRGYDSVLQTATLTRFDGYWNASGLQALGQFGVKTVHIVHITGKDAAIAAYGNGQVNYLDGQFTFNAADKRDLTNLGANVVQVSDPTVGWQEMVLNDNSPIWGKGTATPLGQSNPSQAAFAARMVRKAFSYLVPRQYIISNLLLGIGKIGITEFHPLSGVITPGDIYRGISPDPYDPAAARSFLAAAGYQTGVPNPVGGIITFPPIQPITIGAATVSVPNFVLGNTFSVTGFFKIDPIVSASHNGFAVILQQSADGGKTWKPVIFTVTPFGSTAYTLSYAPSASGTFSYRVLFTGIPGEYVQKVALSNATFVQAQLFKDVGGSVLTKANAANVTTPQFGPASLLTVGTLGDLVSALVTAESTQLQSAAAQLTNSLNTLSTNTQSALNSLQQSAASKTDLNTLSTQVGNLSNNVTSLTDISYAALAVAVVLGLLAIGLSFRKRAS